MFKEELHLLGSQFWLCVMSQQNVQKGIATGTLKMIEQEEEKYLYTNSFGNEKEYNKMSKASNPYGDGKKACERIVDIILEGL